MYKPTTWKMYRRRNGANDTMCNTPHTAATKTAEQHVLVRFGSESKENRRGFVIQEGEGVSDYEVLLLLLL